MHVCLQGHLKIKCYQKLLTLYVLRYQKVEILI